MNTTTVTPQEEAIKPVLSDQTIAKTSALVYVYCPLDQVDTILAVLERNHINFILNDYSITDFKRKLICHYRSAEFDCEENAFLIAATESGAWVEPIVSYIDRRLGFTETELLHPHYFLHQKSFSLLSSAPRRAIKRALDLFCVMLLALIAIPVGLITAVFIKLESPGPIFFKQRRTGQYNKEFEVIKFRSMRNDAEKNGAQWASKNDVRVTRVGKFIRKTRIDELPQLINIIKGEMSLIGPRPEREVFIEELEKTIPYYRFRHAIKPGVTGLAQVKYAYGASVEDAVWKHKYDIYYIKHQSLMLDIKVILLTVKTVVFGMGQ
ncbi:exopolysaccharide biosynthesis polyprenyl glycosylphosphotransferase [Photobacterium phosphoreum]|uniref:exopolysaccharide biosynthesis polyprenyl glycosylphosphotransferase n=1 Tax=Photobacterium phosphoreum TaxID=659 RepID=UPI000D173C45|nr:exopolysaccharide biosynthesis polyprenyl glycosylphosphotransferase [Photobacterium phosphoreum]PTB30984.1 exopolysaccharide biosynthesis protein [Photobacterium phosphoreum]